jgi:hypothetical protein
MLRLTPAQRLAVLQDHVDLVRRLRRGGRAKPLRLLPTLRETLALRAARRRARRWR